MNIRAQQYELTFILRETVQDDAAKTKVEFVKELIKKQGGTTEKEELWGRRELAYEIDRNRTGFYTTLWFTAPGTAVNPLEQELRFDTDIIRFLTTKAYVTAEAASLYPAAEEKGKDGKEEATGEEAIRRNAKPEKEVVIEEELDLEPGISEEERLEKLDAALDEILKEEEK